MPAATNLAATNLEVPQPTARPGRSVRTTWTYTLGSMVFILVVLDFMLVILALEPFTSRSEGVAGLLLLALFIVVAAQIRYCWFLRAGLNGGLPSTPWTLALLVSSVAVWVLGLFSTSNALMWSLPLWLAASLVACLLPSRQRLVVLGAGLATTLLHPTIYSLLHGHSYGFPEEPGLRMLLSYAALMPVVLISSLWWWRIVVELDRHRLMAGELAVAQERLRFAADLHDIQGHHLQVIALKSELAERLLTIDLDAARGHIHDARLSAKQALEETRSLVSGYRGTVLENELENAREVLSAAGAHCELTIDPIPGNPDVHKALAMAVREATTNILRHSDATLASITLVASADSCNLTIRNNGVTSDSLVNKSPGNGLKGLRERISALGGQVETILDAERFELQASVPSQGIAS
ncbi:histidine kinase [Paenarthrobacter sp. OM7]|uniref:sensor histidine kinase n=1 Tax=Paenarthrobacter sp. OM7 TaxID=3041264 RepID=UPI00246974C0|nr:histidine kinase [Paenarthrobacter sp. OM7]WGM20646.1 histidine kinase [Paenarthrobacter sp. OM7]